MDSLLDVELPEYLPLLRYGLRAEVPHLGRRVPAGGDGGDAHLPLSALLAQVLLAFTLDFERESDLSLAISANVVRLIGDNGARVRVLPRLAGVSKQAISMSVGFLEKRGYAVREADPNDSRARLLRLTAKGGEAHDAYRRLLVDIGTRWRVRFGEDKIRNLRTSLDPVAGASGERRRCCVSGWSRMPVGGARRSASPTGSRTIRWCCTAAGSLTAVDD